MKKTEKKVISIILLMVMLLAMLIPSISLATTGEITINDSKLKETIAQEVDANKDGIITKEEMKKLGHIDIPEGVTDLTGLEYATNLGIINVIYTEATENLIGEIKSECEVHISMTISASVKDDSIIKLDFLKNVKNLTELFINAEDTTSWQKVDYSILKDLKGLRILKLCPQIVPKSISELGDISSLKVLCLESEEELIGDTSMKGIENLVNLETLNIDYCNISDVSRIGELKNLEYINLKNVTGVSDLSVLAQCNKLKSLIMRSTDLSDISFLKNKESITELHLENSPIKNIKGMKDLMLLVSTLPNLDMLCVDLEGLKIENLEKYKEMADFLSADEPETVNSNTENTEKAQTEAKSETKTSAEKPTRIPQAGINVVVSILVAMCVVILVVAFEKAKRK